MKTHEGVALSLDLLPSGLVASPAMGITTDRNIGMTNDARGFLFSLAHTNSMEALLPRAKTPQMLHSPVAVNGEYLLTINILTCTHKLMATNNENTTVIASIFCQMS